MYLGQIDHEGTSRQIASKMYWDNHCATAEMSFYERLPFHENILAGTDG